MAAGFLQTADLIDIPAKVAMLWVFPTLCFCYGITKVFVAQALRVNNRLRELREGARLVAGRAGRAAGRFAADGQRAGDRQVRPEPAAGLPIARMFGEPIESIFFDDPTEATRMTRMLPLPHQGRTP